MLMPIQNELPRLNCQLSFCLKGDRQSDIQLNSENPNQSNHIEPN